jgi:hypothetical protein
MDQYPKWKYGEDGASRVVKDEDEESALEGTWWDSPADVVPAEKVPTEEEQLLSDAKEEKAELMAEATSLGLSIDGRAGIAKIKSLIAAAKQKTGE